MSQDRPGLELSILNEVTQVATRRQGSVHFAGFLVREDGEAIYVADTLGTWVIPRASVAFMEDWKSAALCAPDYMNSLGGRPVRVGVLDGATIHEIRPWKMRIDLDAKFHTDVRQATESVFTLGGAGLPVQSPFGERQLRLLEDTFSRRLGWNPDDPCTNPVARQPGDGPLAMGSHTIVPSDGYCDADPGF